MREILFRGKRIDNGEWVEGCLLYDSEQNEGYISECFEDKAAYIREVIPETVGQYTGLRDSTKWEQLTVAEQSEWLKYHKKEEWNGKKIFEGDIVKIAYCFGWDDEQEKDIPEEEYISKVYSIDGCPFCVDLLHCDGDMSPIAWLDWSYDDAEIQVIGNIHDNPELLKEETNNG